MGVKTRKLGNVNNQLVQWQAVHTASTLNAVAGRGYFINTTANICTITLPTPAVGDVIRLKDYARTWNTNKVTIASALLDGATTTTDFNTQGQTVSLVYMDGTKGWSIINEDTTSSLVPPAFTAATGGTVTTSGDFKIHTFTGDSNFVVSTIGNSTVSPTGGPNAASYLVIAGGGGGGKHQAGGGGAGGFREGRVSTPEYTASPLATTGLTIAAQTYPITVGGGGAAGSPGTGCDGVNGGNSIFSTITSAGGGYGGGYDNLPNGVAGGNGGSGGGGSSSSQPTGALSNGGTGNTPPVSPPQGNNGGGGYTPNPHSGGGGGGAGAVGSSVSSPGQPGGPGGNGSPTNISGSDVTRAGGGGGSAEAGPAGGNGGSGGGGTGGRGGTAASTAGSANTGGGGGGGGSSSMAGAAGGSGIVIIRYKFQ